MRIAYIKTAADTLENIPVKRSPHLRSIRRNTIHLHLDITKVQLTRSFEPSRAARQAHLSHQQAIHRVHNHRNSTLTQIFDNLKAR